MKNNLWLLRRIWKYVPGYVVWMATEGVIWGINHSVSILYMEKLFDALGMGADFQTAASIILWYAVYLAFFYMFHHWYWELYNPKVREKLHVAMHGELFAQAVSMDLAKYDDPAFYNDFVWAMDQAFPHAVGLMEDTGKLINRVVASFTLTGVLLSVDTQMAAVIFTIAAVRIGLALLANRVVLSRQEAINPLERKELYLNRVFQLPDYAKQLRVSHVAQLLLGEFERNVLQKRQIISGYGKREALLSFIQSAVAVAGESGLLILVLYKTMVTKQVGLGSFAVAVYATWKMAWLLRDMVDRLMKYHEHGIFVGKMIRFLQCQKNVTDGTLTACDLESLTVHNLRFSYGTGEACALESVNMEIKKGEKIAIVGYNGAGKTTLTKLLMRLYDPDAGEILYNGKNIKEYTLKSLRKRVAAVFQDYRIFACSVAENVAGGPCMDSQYPQVEKALGKSVFGECLMQLPKGVRTSLTREFDPEGTQLSGGEQQKIAIARAFFKDADLIILDEPSSALDPDAEYALNQAISEYADQKTVIFISHRLSTTRNADRIYMFEQGRVIESGTHEQLLEADGKYAHMFRLQAEKYRGQASGQ